MVSRTSERAAGLFVAHVVSNRRVCDAHFVLRLRASGFPDAQPGMFVGIRCGSTLAAPDDAVSSDSGGRGGEEAREPFLRRPFSIAGIESCEGGRDVDIMFRVVGPGTRWMSNLTPGGAVSLLGPVGRAFSMVEGASLHVVVGGGVGLPPVMWLARRLAAQGRATVAVCGARSRSLLPMTIEERGGNIRVREFGDVPVAIATDDGSFGQKGTVIDAARTALGPRKGGGSDIAFYACGPEPMLRAVAELARERGAACQVCMERTMACGIGTCQSCVVPIHEPAAEAGWVYKLCCKDGPVFDARDVVW